MHKNSDILESNKHTKHSHLAKHLFVLHGLNENENTQQFGPTQFSHLVCSPTQLKTGMLHTVASTEENEVVYFTIIFNLSLFKSQSKKTKIPWQ